MTPSAARAHRKKCIRHAEYNARTRAKPEAGSSLASKAVTVQRQDAAVQEDAQPLTAEEHRANIQAEWEQERAKIKELNDGHNERMRLSRRGL